MEGVIEMLWAGSVTVFVVSAMAWLWRLHNGLVALSKQAKQAEQQAESQAIQITRLQSILRLLVVGTAADCEAEGERIIRERNRSSDFDDADAVRLHSNWYYEQMGYGGWNEMEAFVEAHPVLRFGERQYTLSLHKVDHEEMYGTDYSGHTSYLVVQSSDKAENAGTADWPHLTEQAHENLCALLEGLYGGGEETTP